jgi:hypothetical protein
MIGRSLLTTVCFSVFVRNEKENPSDVLNKLFF